MTNFSLTKVKSLKDINEIFDYQIKKYGEFPFKIEKELFNLTLNFTIKQWGEIRTPEYWEQYDRIPGENLKKAFTLTTVKDYLKFIR